MPVTNPMSAVMHRAAKNTTISIPPGWDKLLIALNDDLTEMDSTYEIVAARVTKGQLRFLAVHSDDIDVSEWNERIIAAMQAAEETCMVCGSKGDYDGARVLCAKHRRSRLA